MTRPYTICHMQTALDGKIIGEYMNTPEAETLFSTYVEIQESYEPDAWICGRITMAEAFAFGEAKEFTKESVSVIPRTDFIANNKADRYMIAADPKGKLRWAEHTVPTSFQLKVASHIVVVITEAVADDYLTYLQELGISYIFGGKDNLNFTMVLEKLHNLLDVKKMMIDGGGYLNGAFLNEDLIDELSLVVTPAADGAISTPALFARAEVLTEKPATSFVLNDVRKLDANGVYLNYSVKR